MYRYRTCTRRDTRIRMYSTIGALASASSSRLVVPSSVSVATGRSRCCCWAMLVRACSAYGASALTFQWKAVGRVRLNTSSASARFVRGKSVAGQGYHALSIHCARSTRTRCVLSNRPTPAPPSVSQSSPSTAGGVLTPTSEVCTPEAYPRSEEEALSSGHRAQSLPQKTVTPATPFLAPGAERELAPSQNIAGCQRPERVVWKQGRREMC